ncbi:lysine--tRNA ligase [Candidatus Woesebacteria bacterium GWA1_42_12]|uniref:Lysine--tRNA ligase n=1 Tax=Candidatus Woesebacteria bacterium GWA1_42_12 TaxID=1802472 RepID=A0A1F7WNF4_9BACT|nr:MAG: lysine--tRNA ligase [Candidatus Woesebacteria bacterium GWA1_42_12]
MARAIDAIKKDRIEKLEKLKGLGVNPYPSKIELSGDLVKIAKARESLGKKVLTAGRIWSLRKHGGVIFADLKDDSEKIQLLFQEKSLGKDFEVLDLIDTADFLAAIGEVIKTPAGEVTVDVEKYQLLSKALRPLPDEWYGLKDVEERFRKRYLDLLLNPEVRKRFDVRSQLVREVRGYLDGLGYLEVETPTLQPLYGGANAKPFKTHLNALDADMYLRIADELYLKRLVVGGYEKVYEICKDFRNEGMDLAHNPEFTMIEYYEAYADYGKVMDVTEGLFKHLAQAIFGKMELSVADKVIDISKKWPRITMTDILKDKLGLDISKESQESLAKFCKDKGMTLVGGESKGQLTFLIFEHQVTPLLVDPTWIIDYPKDVSPLSKDHKEEGWVERFEGYIGGKEICDGWSEVNDPLEQRRRFESDTLAARKDKEEAQQVDEDFIEAMEYGMPPLGGIGIGIDRLTMFFTNTWSIKEVILFPTMRPEK